jgi:hypothetical protein
MSTCGDQGSSTCWQWRRRGGGARAQGEARARAPGPWQRRPAPVAARARPRGRAQPAALPPRSPARRPGRCLKCGWSRVIGTHGLSTAGSDLRTIRCWLHVPRQATLKYAGDRHYDWLPHAQRDKQHGSQSGSPSPAGCGARGIRAAYRALAWELHPDRRASVEGVVMLPCSGLPSFRQPVARLTPIARRRVWIDLAAAPARRRGHRPRLRWP